MKARGRVRQDIAGREQRFEIAGLIDVEPFGADLECEAGPLNGFDGAGHCIGLAPRDVLEHATVSFAGGNRIKTTVGSGAQSDVRGGLEQILNVRDGQRRRVAAENDHATVARRETGIEGVNHF